MRLRGTDACTARTKQQERATPNRRLPCKHSSAYPAGLEFFDYQSQPRALLPHPHAPARTTHPATRRPAAVPAHSAATIAAIADPAAAPPVFAPCRAAASATAPSMIPRCSAVASIPSTSHRRRTVSAYPSSIRTYSVHSSVLSLFSRSPRCSSVRAAVGDWLSSSCAAPRIYSAGTSGCSCSALHAQSI